MLSRIVGINQGSWRIYSMSQNFIGLFERESGDDEERARRDGIEKGIIDGIPVYYRGSLPSEPAVLIATDREFLSYDERLALYLSALEASLSGYSVITIARRGGLSSVLRGVEDGKGRLHAVSEEGLRVMEEKRLRKLRRIMLLGGSAISSGLMEGNREAAVETALSLSLCLITTGRSCILTRALDRGLDAAVIRSSLSRKEGRRAAGEGCPVIDTFSSFSAFPKCIAYHDEAGPYGFGTERFGILEL